jgi:hypothetical protein
MEQFTRARQRVGTLLLVAIVWLMPAIAGAARAATDKLQILLNDTAAQLQLAYRQHPDERARRQDQLNAAVTAWRAAPRSEANNEQLATWLRAAILNSMPGSKEPLPAVPSFAAVVKADAQADMHKLADAVAEPKTAEMAIDTKAPIKTAAKPVADPFRDDPISDGK